jgi:hypothetical protein
MGVIRCDVVATAFTTLLSLPIHAQTSTSTPRQKMVVISLDAFGAVSRLHLSPLANPRPGRDEDRPHHWLVFWVWGMKIGCFIHRDNFAMDEAASEQFQIAKGL